MACAIEEKLECQIFVSQNSSPWPNKSSAGSWQLNFIPTRGAEYKKKSKFPLLKWGQQRSGPQNQTGTSQHSANSCHTGRRRCTRNMSVHLDASRRVTLTCTFQHELQHAARSTQMKRLLRVSPSSVSSPPCTESCLPHPWIEGISSWTRLPPRRGV